MLLSFNVRINAKVHMNKKMIFMALLAFAATPASASTFQTAAALRPKPAQNALEYTCELKNQICQKVQDSSNVAAFLDVIAYAEGTQSHYNYSFGFHVFSSYDDHPRELYCEGSLCSDAAGRYQFLSTTWDPLRNAADLPDFSPENQDRAAVLLLKQIDAYSAVTDISSFDDFYEALKLCATTWASLPGSPYGQPTHSASELWSVFQNNLNRRDAF